jgi:endonuclease/exonuclease/phosphatase family metal-dependent hydrolase
MNFIFRNCAALLVAASATISAGKLQAQLRIVDYNTTAGPRSGMDVVLTAIGAHSSVGIARPPDVLALQEQSSSASTTQGIVNILNSIYGAGVYARATLDGATTGAGRPGLIYNSQTVEVIAQHAFGITGTSAQARQTLRYQLRPVGYDSTADFYVFSNHYKAGTSSTDRTRRTIEATALRANLDGLGAGIHAILAGDYNIQSSAETSYQTLLAPGNGQAFDPISRPGTWHNNLNFRDAHTQAPAANPGPGLVGGGVDDRFDFQLLTAEFLDGEGLSYLPGSYSVLGNNGTHGCCDASISTGSGASTTVLAALETASDHMPVIADYQLPAVLAVTTDNIPATLQLGQSFSVQVNVWNAANVPFAIGADELNYGLVASGDVTGSVVGVDDALGTMNGHLVSFNTSSLGEKSGFITVESDSQSVAHGFWQLPISYTVVPVPEPSGFGILVTAIVFNLYQIPNRPSRRTKVCGAGSCAV